MKKPQNFTVYLKDGRNFQIKNATFDITNAELNFYGEFDKLSDLIYLSLNDVAAIIPERKQDTPPYFDVYLKESECKVTAARYKITDNKQLEFSDERNYKLHSIYIDLSEVVALNLVSSE